MISTPENTFQVTIIGDHGLWHIGRPIDSESRSQWFESHYFLECSFQTFSLSRLGCKQCDQMVRLFVHIRQLQQ